MTAGALLDKASRLYSQNFALMLGISVIVHIPSIALRIIRFSRTVVGTRPGIQAVLPELLWLLIEMLIISPWTGGAAVQAVSDVYLGNDVTVTSALREAWKKYPALLRAHFVPVLSILGGFFLCLIPGVLLLFSYAFITPIVMLESVSKSRDIRRRSRSLVQGYRGKVFVIVVIVFLMDVLAQAGFRVMLRPFIGAAATTSIAPILVECVGIVASPMASISLTLLYYDLRIRKEGFDLELLSSGIRGGEEISLS